jgi:hypothetical protein
MDNKVIMNGTRIAEICLKGPVFIKVKDSGTNNCLISTTISTTISTMK